MFIPLHDTNSLKHIKVQYVTIGLIVINVLVWLITGPLASKDFANATVLGLGYIPALAFDYARRHHMLEGVSVLDFQLLRTIKDMTSHLEVKQCTTGEWEQAILQGFNVWRSVLAARGGRIAVDLDQRRIDYLGLAEADQELSDPSP